MNLKPGIDLWSFNHLIGIFEKMKNTKDNTILVISHQERILNIADEIILLKERKNCRIKSKIRRYIIRKLNTL